MPADLTLILGPQTRGALAVNAYVREASASLAKAGVRALPNRIASPLIRTAINARQPIGDRMAAFEQAIAPRPVVLAALNAFGPPEAALKNGEFFPDAEAVLEGLAPVADTARYVLMIDRLPALYLSPGSEGLEARVKAMPWDVLYEFGWARLAQTLAAVIPKAELLVLTPEALATRPADVMTRIFGSKVGDPIRFLRAALNETGCAVLDRMLASRTPDQAMLDALYTSFADAPTLADIHHRLGIEKITATLLEQRYREDLDAIAALPRAEVI